uniref:Uncharacterized protein n=1 Tax=Octopus bimaculoides TaxID=37653 RepID=A0A0L8HJS0_OCTBM
MQKPVKWSVPLFFLYLHLLVLGGGGAMLISWESTTFSLSDLGIKLYSVESIDTSNIFVSNQLIKIPPSLSYKNLLC